MVLIFVSTGAAPLFIPTKLPQDRPGRQRWPVPDDPHSARELSSEVTFSHLGWWTPRHGRHDTGNATCFSMFSFALRQVDLGISWNFIMSSGMFMAFSIQTSIYRGFNVGSWFINPPPPPPPKPKQGGWLIKDCLKTIPEDWGISQIKKVMIPSNYSSALLSSIHFACVAKATTTPKKNALIKTLLQNLLFNNLAPPGLPLWKIGKAQFFIWILIKGPSISASSQFSKWAIESNLKR